MTECISNCTICGHPLRYTNSDAIYEYYKCRGCNMSFMKAKAGVVVWLYLENRPWEKMYGKWVVCTKELRFKQKEMVIFS